jgi:arylformamidase
MVMTVLERSVLIDVSQGMEDFVFPGNPAVEKNGPFSRVGGRNREFVYDLSLCSQSGTHIQGPHYFLEDGKTIDRFPIEDFEGPCVLVDLEKRGADTTAEDLERLIRPRETKLPVLILRTGHMEEVLATGILDPARRPGLSPDAAFFLTERTSFRMIGIDSVGLESRNTENFEVNLHLCRQGMLILEGLVNLFAVKQRLAFLHAFPLKLSGVEGTPCRAVIRVKPGSPTLKERESDVPLPRPSRRSGR